MGNFIISLSIILVFFSLFAVHVYLLTHNVPFIKPKYSVDIYVYNYKRNFNGEIIYSDVKYVLCRSIPYFLCETYLSLYDDNEVSFTELKACASTFETKEEAEKKLQDILDKPNKYILRL